MRLDLAWAESDRLLAFVRRLPVVGQIVPAPQVFRWEVVAVYRVQLRVERPCSFACYEAVLLDATS